MYKYFLLITYTTDNKLWWLKDPERYMLDVIPLDERVERIVVNMLFQKPRITFDEILEEIYTNFQNSLTPASNIKEILDIYGEKIEGGYWRLRETVRNELTSHDSYIDKISKLGSKLGYSVHSDISEWRKDEESIPLNGVIDLKRILEIDCIWYKERNIEAIFEVENSTAVSEAIIRGSNLVLSNIRRFIIIPDSRISFLKKRLKEPMLKANVSKYGWNFLTYSYLDKNYDRIKDLEDLITEITDISRESYVQTTLF